MIACVAPTTQRVKPDEAAVAIEAEKQREIAIKEGLKSRQRLLRIGGPILKKSLPFCKDRKRNKVIIVSVIDNLIKGASGQAVQNMNVAYNMRESLGLT